MQTLVLDKERFPTQAAANRWVRSHNFHVAKVDETEGSWRYRQREPGDFRRGSFRTINIAEGVKAVTGRLQAQEASEVTSIPSLRLYAGFDASVALADAGDGEAAVSWVQVFKLGTFRHPAGTFSVDDAFLASVASSFKYMQTRGAEIPVDYEHGSAQPGATPEAARAAGWVQRLEHRQSEGMWAEVAWTEDAVDFISAREYRYISPEFHPEYTDEKGVNLGPTLLAVGLVNRPHLKGMEAVSLREIDMDNEPTTAAADATVETPDAEPAPEATHKAAEVADDALVDLTAKVEALAELVAGLAGGGEAEGEVEGEEEDMYAASEAAAIPAEVTQVVADLNARLKAVEAENTSLRSDREAVAAKADVDAAFGQGRITRAQYEPFLAIRLKDAGAFRALVEATPGTVKAGEVEHGFIGGSVPEDKPVDLIGTIKAKAEADGTTFEKAWKVVRRSQPELVAAHYRQNPDEQTTTLNRLMGGN